ncbi:MAG: hypothetical protein IPJ10_13800 [Flavobacteriales bacterium]|nr:hypothetical protein [Flavobacteriales bacterium]
MSETGDPCPDHLDDDPDEGVYAEVRGRIVELGDHVVPVLERAWNSMTSGTFPGPHRGHPAYHPLGRRERSPQSVESDRW